MNLHEFQAKDLLARHGIPTLKGKVATTPAEAARGFGELGLAGPAGWVAAAVVKAQVHAGGRGKAGGIIPVKSAGEAEAAAAKLLGKPLVTYQSGPAGKMVRSVLLEESCASERELYAGIVIDRRSNRAVLMASSEGGVEIEVVAQRSPEKILKEEIHAGLGLQAFQTRRLAKGLGLSGDLLKQAPAVFLGMAKLFTQCDASLLEINPLAVVPGRGLIALDAKVNLDDRALYRHEDLAKMRDVEQEDPMEVEASRIGISYVSLDGNIGCMVNGAGLAMSTMDLIKYAGGAPSNFLDVGGGASKEQVTAAFRLILSNEKVKGILVNIFGGIMKCDVIAQGITDAVKEMGLKVPLVVRLEGTNVEAGRAILRGSGLNLVAASDMKDAAEKIVKAVG